MSEEKKSTWLHKQYEDVRGSLKSDLFKECGLPVLVTVGGAIFQSLATINHGEIVGWLMFAFGLGWIFLSFIKYRKAHAPANNVREPNAQAAIIEPEPSVRTHVLRKCADSITNGIPPLRALIDAGADELKSNADVVDVCKALEVAGSKNPLVLWDMIPESDYLEFLHALRIGSVNVSNDKAVYEYLKTHFLSRNPRASIQ